MRFRGQQRQRHEPERAARLAVQLQNRSLVIVVDETGLEGDFTWEIDLAMRPGPPAVRGGVSPGLYAAIRDQLGLLLEPTEASIEVVVIDAVSMPAPN